MIQTWKKWPRSSKLNWLEMGRCKDTDGCDSVKYIKVMLCRKIQKDN